MRTILTAALAGGLLFLSNTALADPISAISVSPKAQEIFAKKYGTREIDELSATIKRSVATHLAKRGIAERPDLRVEVTLVDAVPSHPTFKQMGDNVSLDMFSVSLGGADLQARLVDGAGQTVDQVNYSWYQYNLRDSATTSTWGDADFAIGRFARKVADAYAART